MNDRFESGLKTRKEVLGSDYVENSIRNATDFDRPFQEFITSSAWDGVWNRGPLDRKTKSLITLSVRSEERRVGKECRSRWSPYP